MKKTRNVRPRTNETNRLNCYGNQIAIGLSRGFSRIFSRYGIFLGLCLQISLHVLLSYPGQPFTFHFFATFGCSAEWKSTLISHDLASRNPSRRAVTIPLSLTVRQFVRNLFRQTSVVARLLFGCSVVALLLIVHLRHVRIYEYFFSRTCGLRKTLLFVRNLI